MAFAITSYADLTDGDLLLNFNSPLAIYLYTAGPSPPAKNNVGGSFTVTADGRIESPVLANWVTSGGGVSAVTFTYGPVPVTLIGGYTLVGLILLDNGGNLLAAIEFSSPVVVPAGPVVYTVSVALTFN